MYPKNYEGYSHWQQFITKDYYEFHQLKDKTVYDLCQCKEQVHWDIYEDDHGHAAAHGHCHHRVYIDDDDDKGGVPIKEERNDVSNYLLTDRDPLLSKDDILGQLL